MSRLPGGLLLRLAERLCSPEACRRILLPIVADLQFEWRQAEGAAARLRVRLRGSWAFSRGLLPALIAEDHTGTQRVLRHMTLATLAQALLLLLVGLGRSATIDEAHLILPAILTVALPTGCLLGASWPDRASDERPRWRPLLAVATLMGAVTFAVFGWLTPRANQALRERLVERATGNRWSPDPGARERTLGELSAREKELRREGRTGEARLEALEWHKKPALAASCVALAVMGMALRRLARALRLALSLLVIVGVFSLLRFMEQAARQGVIEPALAVWGAVGVMATAALLAAITWAGRRARPRPSSHGSIRG